PVFEDEEAAAVPLPKVAIVGQRNSGKSTLVNKLAKEDRVIVSEIPGTTRDSVDVRIGFGDDAFTVIDTAGLRKKKSVQDSVEFYGQARTARAIRRADVVLLLIDATRDISQVDKGIADMVVDACKPCILGLNKWDLVKDHGSGAFEEYVVARLPNLRFAPLTFLSALTGFNVQKTFSLIRELKDQAEFRAPTAEINRVLQEALVQRSPRVKKSKVPKIYFGVQVSVCPPTILAFVNDTKLFNDEYRRYLVGRFQEALPYKEVPLRILFRGKPKET
ncbi:MAG: 50S ribosome-binding GTPase, partial [Planctomycetes bacterium]|nr:50S ribosome-binding GTPase [Planctomycetota bacterium]